VLLSVSEAAPLTDQLKVTVSPEEIELLLAVKDWISGGFADAIRVNKQSNAHVRHAMKVKERWCRAMGDESPIIRFGSESMQG
jgi:hypothetical protein